MDIKPVVAESIPLPEQTSVYPPPFDAMMAGREKRKLGDFFGLTHFGINQTQLAPGAVSALMHHHSRSDEFLYILQGTATLLLDDREYSMGPGQCIGIKADSGQAAQLVNRGEEPVLYLEMGDRSPGDEVVYPRDDLMARQDEQGNWLFTHKDGRPY